MAALTREQVWAEKLARGTRSSDVMDIRAANERLQQFEREQAQEARRLLTLTEINEFTTRLEGPEGCDFHRDAQDEIRWQCEGGRDLTRAEGVLRLMAIDVDRAEGFLAACVANGGHCSCEILFNALPRIAPEIDAGEGDEA